MKKLFLFSIMMLATAGYLFAQKDADAKAILAKVSATYKAYDVVKTDFVFALDNPQAGIKESRNGTLVAKSKTNKFHVTIFDNEGGKQTEQQEIISDGKTQWTYMKKDKEVQVNN